MYGQTNVPARGGVVIAANHQSYMDPPLLVLALDRMAAFMARRSLFRHPLFAALVRGLNAFPISRGQSDPAAVRGALQRLKNGWCMILFPEGTRTRDGRIGRLRPGVFRIADRAGVPIVPAIVEGAFQAWPRQGRLRRHPISVWYGRPISAETRRIIGLTESMALLRSEFEKGRAALRKMQARAR